MSAYDAQIDGLALRIEFEEFSELESKALVGEVEEEIRVLRSCLPQSGRLELATLAAMTLCLQLERIHNVASMEELEELPPSRPREFISGREGEKAPEVVHVTIEQRQMSIQWPGMESARLVGLAESVTKRIKEVGRDNRFLGDSRKLAILTCLYYAAEISNAMKELEAASPLGSPPAPRIIMSGRIKELLSPQGCAEKFRAQLVQDNGGIVRLIIPASLIDTACQVFVAGERVSLTGRMLAGDQQGSFRVAKMA